AARRRTGHHTANQADQTQRRQPYGHDRTDTRHEGTDHRGAHETSRSANSTTHHTPDGRTHPRLLCICSGHPLKLNVRGTRNQEVDMLPCYAKAIQPLSGTRGLLLGGKNTHNCLHDDLLMLLSPHGLATVCSNFYAIPWRPVDRTAWLDPRRQSARPGPHG